jgi:Double-GTPase 2
MAYRCANPDCAYPETGVCARRAEFADPESQCVDLRRGRQASVVLLAPPEKPAGPARPSEPVAEPAVPADRFWSGMALGGEDAGAMLWDSRTRLFTLMGGEDRGKTCLLTALYIQMANGFTSGFPWRFCGSRSLQGFQQLADKAFEWKGGETRIVPRTTQSSFRQPSFLHLALRRRERRDASMTQVLLTDLPGEWFERWTDHGTQALLDTLEFLPRSDGFMLAVDAPKLLRDRVYTNDLGLLAERLTAFLGTVVGRPRPIAVVLTKYDEVLRHVPIPAPEHRRDAVAWGKLGRGLGPLFAALAAVPQGTPWEVFPTAAFSRPAAQPVGVLAPFCFLLEHTTLIEPLVPLVVPRVYRGSYFEVFREEGS